MVAVMFAKTMYQNKLFIITSLNLKNYFYSRSLLGGPAAGALYTRGHGSYNYMIIFCGSTMIFGSFFLLAAKLVQGRILARV